MIINDILRFYKLPFVDEFVIDFSQLFLAITIIFVAVVAWRSTSTPDNWQVRAVYVFDRRFRRNRHIPRLTNHTVATTLVESTQPVVDPPRNSESDQEHITISTQTVEEQKALSEGNGSSSSGVRDEREEIIKKMDADSNIVRQRRLAFFNNKSAGGGNLDGASSSSQRQGFGETEPSAPPLINENPTNENLINESPINDNNAPPAYGFNIPDEPIQDLNSIKIRLKYLNDDLKSVDAKLNESLSDFKRRHFSTELAENKRVKLIFNGQLLQREEETLAHYGLYDNCVVHCLIHQTRSVPESNTESSSSSRSGRRNERDWDFGNLLLVLVSILLSLAWYTRYNYPQLFTITSTVALVIITGLFAIVSLGMFFPDQNVPNIEVHLR